MDSPIITLTTDWGGQDFFAGRVKGKLLSSIPDVRIVDITHGLAPFNLLRAIFVIKNACFDFPKGTIHIIDICSSETTSTPFIVVAFRDQYYICTNNGLPSAVFGNDYTEAVVIDNIPYDNNSFTFAACDLFCKVACMIANGAQLSDLGFPVEELVQAKQHGTIVAGNRITVYVAYIDAYGNADLNITFDEFEQYRAGRKFEMIVKDQSIKEISRSYVSTSNTNPLYNPLMLTVSSTGHLQVALRKNSAEQLFGLKELDQFTILFI